MKSFYEMRKERALVCKKIEDEIEKKILLSGTPDIEFKRTEFTEDYYEIKGICPKCKKQVTEQHERSKIDGHYFHFECIELKEKGLCFYCGQPVTNLEERTKDNNGNYYHYFCWKTIN